MNLGRLRRDEPRKRPLRPFKILEDIMSRVLKLAVAAAGLLAVAVGAVSQAQALPVSCKPMSVFPCPVEPLQ